MGVKNYAESLVSPNIHREIRITPLFSLPDKIEKTSGTGELNVFV